MLRNGAKGYLTKNTDPEEILLACHKVINNETYIPP